VDHPKTFVKAWALDSLATLSRKDITLLPAVRQRLREFEGSGSRALLARARHIRERLK
jgi:hypothetical protein